jgi:hypothetical protein
VPLKALLEAAMRKSLEPFGVATSWSITSALVPWLLAGCAAAAEPATPQFERDVWPILATRCTMCHGAQAPKGGLDLRSVSAILRGGDSGPAAVKSDLEHSLLIDKIDSGEMPPPGERKLSAEDKATLREWIARGMPAANPDAIPAPVSSVRDADRQFWSFRPLGPVVVPHVSSVSARTPVDAFLAARLEVQGLSFSPEADRATLLRRLYLDLLGLPPTPEELDAFIADDAPDAYEREVDRLLASPHFGERWGRHWLDVAGYVDTVGFDVDATLIITSEGKWRYRDWVIRAINEDKPYDRFITEQLAGDELYDWRRAERLTDEMRDALVATGYLRTARDLTHEDVGLIRQNYFGIMHDTLETIGTGLLGLTLNCVRCHSHKFDPIPHEDYYRMMALLAPAYNPNAWRSVVPTETTNDDRVLADVAHGEQKAIKQHNAEIDGIVQALRKKLDEIRTPKRQRMFEAELAKLPEAIRADVKTALESPADKRTEVQKYLAEKFSATRTFKPEQIDKQLNESDKSQVAQVDADIRAAESRRRRWNKIQALYDVGPPPATHLLLRGSEETPGEEVQPGFLRVLATSDSAALATVHQPYDGTSGRRLALARWLTQADSPAGALMTRVMVNRAWQQVFGRGIVPTPENFGAQGQPPTHPELLEWLCGQFVQGGWRLKPLVKILVTSTAYRQASRRDSSAANESRADPEVVDPANELLWRQRLRRLESEIVRDSILSAAGTLDRTMGGPPVMINALPDGMVVVAKEKLARPSDNKRRSVYLLTRRAYNLSLLTVFDQPLLATNCLKRDASAVPLQSLFMLNDTFTAEQAQELAKTVEQSAGSAPQDRIEALFRAALARRPSATEAATCRTLLDEQMKLCRAAGMAEDVAAHQALVQLCHTVLNTSEFLYIE